MTDGSKLTARLYFYNRLPVVRRSDADDKACEVRLREVMATIGGFGRSWREIRSARYPESWLHYKSVKEPCNGNQRSIKLYVSPLPEDFYQAVGIVGAVMMRHGACSFKIARHLYGLARPDKIVCYFNDFDAMADAAAAMRERIGQVRPQGVPFTAQLFDTPVLSWGIDPPRTYNRALNEYESWRLWICKICAETLIKARAVHHPDPSRLVADALGHIRVDPDTLVPSIDLFD